MSDLTKNPKPIRVLLVEDSPGDARLIELLLAENETPFEVKIAGKLSEALELLKTETFEVILSDLSLPDSERIETFRRIHDAAPLLPIIVLSGLADEALALQTVEEGAQDYLVKGHVDTHLIGRAIRYAI